MFALGQSTYIYFTYVQSGEWGLVRELIIFICLRVNIIYRSKAPK